MGLLAFKNFANNDGTDFIIFHSNRACPDSWTEATVSQIKKKKKLHYLQTKKNISNVLELKVEKEHRRRKGEAVESLRITDMGRTLEIISNF